jgi:hypothetical protein
MLSRYVGRRDEVEVAEIPFGIGEKSHRSAPVSASRTSEVEKPVLPAPMQSPKSTYRTSPGVVAADDVRPLNGC